MSDEEREAIAGEVAHVVELVASGVEPLRLDDPGV
jgi:hypothetical protein